VRLLYLTPRVPHPGMKGDALVAFHRIEQLAHRHEISLISFYGSSDELEYISSLEEA